MKVEIDREPIPKAVSLAKRPPGPPRRALVVENEPAMCSLIQEVLESAEIESVTPAHSIQNEFPLDDEKFDVILVGFGTASLDGIEFVRKIRRSKFNQRTPIILISDDQRPGALARGFEAGASFFVYKPIDRARLTNLVRATQGAMEQERRRFRRVPVQVKVRIKSEKAVLIGETVDLSLNGALVKSAQILPLGSLIEISIYLQNGAKPVVGLGSVARILGAGLMGLLLDRFPTSEIARLQEFLLPRISD